MEPRRKEPWEDRPQCRAGRDEEKEKEIQQRLKVMFDKLYERRNAICAIMMPGEFFAARSHFELLYTLKGTGLV